MAPAKIIILRHGEKKNGFELCSTGVQRSLALTTKYLGKGGKHSLFDSGGPDGFFAITLHTIELISPSAQSWNLPLAAYTAVPIKTATSNPYDDSEDVLNARTRQAAADVMGGAWAGKTVVMCWEHKHIADKKLDDSSKEPVTLRKLLNLDQIIGDPVPKKWEGENYDYFWIVTYGTTGSDVPTAFEAHKQKFDAPYIDVPDNDWGVAAQLPADCET